jgi:hypothetical protein
VDVDRCFRLEIRDSFFNNGVFRTGGFAYGVDVFNSSTSCLIENNRFYRNRHSMVVAGDGGGNVFGYNCSIDSDQGDGWLAGDIFPHGSHSGADLFEGNVATKIQCDFTHGSSSYHMFYRNFIRVTSAFSTAGQGRRAVDMDIWNQYGNFLGNVLGSPLKKLEQLVSIVLYTFGRLDFFQMAIQLGIQLDHWIRFTAMAIIQQEPPLLHGIPIIPIRH